MGEEHDLTTGVVHELERGAIGRRPPVAPLPHGGEHGPQVSALVGEAVLVAQRPLLVGNLLQHTCLDQARQSVRQDVAGDPQAGLEVVEPTHAQERVADDQHRPPLSDDLQALGHGAVHGLEALPFHDGEDSGLRHTTQWVTFGFMIELEQNGVERPDPDGPPMDPHDGGSAFLAAAGLVITVVRPDRFEGYIELGERPRGRVRHRRRVGRQPRCLGVRGRAGAVRRRGEQQHELLATADRRSGRGDGPPDPAGPHPAALAGGGRRPG